MRYGKLLALFALAVFVVYLGVLAVRVPRLDLQIVVGVTVLLAAYDLWTEIGRRKR